MTVMIKERIGDLPADWEPDCLLTFVETGYSKTARLVSDLPALKAAYDQAIREDSPFFSVSLAPGVAMAAMLDSAEELKSDLRQCSAGLLSIAVEIHLVVCPELRQECLAIMREVQLAQGEGGHA